MSENTMRKVIAALRDTAAKASETKTVKGDWGPSDYMTFRQGEPPSHEVEAVSRDWIIGRLLGMADMIEAMADQEPV